MQQKLRHTLKIPADRYIAVVTSPVYDEWARKKLGLETRAEIERRETEDRIFRKVRMVRVVSERTRAWIKKDRLEMIDTTDIDKRSNTFTWEIVPGIWADRITARAKGRITPAGPDACVRELDLELKVNVFLIGGRIEKALSEKMDDYFVKVNAALEEFYRDEFQKKAASPVS
ncbi:MAG: DUF2505 family protein [Deltaproteobacteria bacterium]|nr:DUF2505 family protein [Deltaproteobacteria bacterium]